MSGKKGMIRYTDAFKQKVKMEYENGLGINELSRKYAVSRYSVQNWCGLRKEVELRRIAPLPKGYRYIHLWLERHKGIYRNPKTILRVMRKYGLLSEVRRKRWHLCGQSIHRYSNLLNRNFKSACINQKWVTDISYIRTTQGFLYLSVIIDLFDNSIVAYKTSQQQRDFN